MPEEYDASEQGIILYLFHEMMWAATKDGGNKRASGEKPRFDVDPDHEPAIFSHLSKWKHGERHDKDSGAHPLVHMAWRALAIAYQELDPQEREALDAKVERMREGRTVIGAALAERGIV